MSRLILVATVSAAVWFAFDGNALAQVGGSFVESCTRIDQRGPVLSALCQDRFGRLVPAQLDLRRCGSGDVANANGRLVCEPSYRRARPRYDDRGGYGDYRRPPRGYYQPY